MAGATNTAIDLKNLIASSIESHLGLGNSVYNAFSNFYTAAESGNISDILSAGSGVVSAMNSFAGMAFASTKISNYATVGVSATAVGAQIRKVYEQVLRADATGDQIA